MDKRLSAKIALEMELIRPLGEACAAYIYAWGRKEGAMPLLDRIAYLNTLEAVLERHYARVMLAMSGRDLDPEPRLQDAAPTLTMAERYKRRAHAQAHWIIRGIDRELAAAMAASNAPKAAPLDLEVKKDRFSVGISVRFKEAVINAWRKVKGKLKAMANVETEGVAEDTTYEWVKQQHANARIYKVWNSLMDGKERPTHHAAHGQERLVDEAFDVGSSKLRWPGDTFLNADLSEIINCRCFLTYVAVRDDGARLDLPIATPTISAKRPWRPGDKFGDPTPILPTTLVTLNGRTRARIVLGDGRTQATLEQTTPSTIVVRIGRNTIARAETRGPDVTSITIAPGQEHQGIETLIRDSVRHSATRPRKQ